MWPVISDETLNWGTSRLPHCDARVIWDVKNSHQLCMSRGTTQSSQSIKIDLSIDCIDQSVEIDDTLVSFIDLSWFLPISSIYIGRYICPSVHPKMKTDFMQTVNLSTAELQLRVEGSNNYITFKTIWKILSFLQENVGAQFFTIKTCRLFKSTSV